MGLENNNFVGRCHCPECNCLYIIIDNKVISCPVCELNSHQNLVKAYKEEVKEEIVQYQV